MVSTVALPEFTPQESNQAHAFLLLCLRSRFEPQVRESLSSFINNNDLDWALISRQINQERISPLIFSVLRDQNWLPEALEKQYRYDYLRTAIYNKFMLNELAHVAQIFKDGGVPVIALKGAALIELVYKNMAIRPMRDIDLLIHRDHGEKAFKILDETGYDPGTEFFPGQALLFDKELHFSKPGKQPVNIDLHWHLFNSKFYRDYLPLDWFWDSAQTIETGGIPILSLSPEAQLLYLGGHIWLSKHAIEPMLIWLNDIAALIYTHEDRIDWDLLLRQTEKCQLVYTVRHTLQKLNREWNVPVPMEVLARLETMNPSPFELDIITRYVEERSPLERARDKLSDAPNRRHRAALALRWLFPSPAFLRFRYGNSHTLALPFLYLYRGWLGLRLGIKMISHHLFEK